MRLFSIAPYLLLVCFATGQAAEFTAKMAGVLTGSPYDGVAMMYRDPYDHGPDGRGDKAEEFKRVARMTEKDVWPWVFLNRMVGAEPGKGITAKTAGAEHFGAIKGMDLDNATGDREAFLRTWRGAFRTARKAGAPGVVVDLEAYNNYDTYDTGYVAAASGKTLEETRAALRRLGADMADAAGREYPGAVVWTLFTAVDRERKSRGGGPDDYTTFAYIVMGLLERDIEAGYGLEVVSGGEWGVKYCSLDIDDLKRKIAGRAESFGRALAAYPNLRLGGTIAPWPDAGMKQNWMLEGECGKCGAGGAEEFVPYFRELAGSYAYVWIYGASMAGYSPYDREVASVMDRALREGFGLQERQPGAPPGLQGRSLR